MNYTQERLRAQFGKYRRRETTSLDRNISTSPSSVAQHTRPPPIIPSTISDPLAPHLSNPLIYQSFEWYTPSDPHSGSSYYTQLTSSLPHLKSLGVTLLWLPPGCKAANPTGNGYDIYDLWDLGEFDWKGQKPTKWGCKEELEDLCEKAKGVGVGVLWDAVLNHRCGADFAEDVEAVEIDAEDRRKVVGKVTEIKAWTGFDFPARAGKYSDLKLRKEHFNAIDWDDKRKEKKIFNLCHEDGKPKGWTKDVDAEFGNFDYLLGTNITYTSPALRQDVLKWSVWITRQLSLSGFRLDAVKHMSLSFVLQLLTHLQDTFGRDFFIVGEYWKWDSGFLKEVVGRLEGRCRLYDVQLCYHFSDYSIGKKSDLRRILEGSLVEKDAAHSVTIVSNHDTQPTQVCAVPFERWFLPHAYVLILLRACRSIPCVFHGHMHGIEGPEPQAPLPFLPRLMRVRTYFAYGTQYNYWDEADCIGWTRIGREGNEMTEGCAVLLSSAKVAKNKRMFVGTSHAGSRFRDMISGREGFDVRVGEDGFGVFHVEPRGAGVWVRNEEMGRLL